MVGTQEHIVAVVYFKPFVTQNGVFAEDAHPHALSLHRSRQTERQAQLIIGIVDIGGEIRPPLVDASLEERIEGIIGIVLVVTNLGAVSGAQRVGDYGKAQRVEQDTVYHQRVYLHPAIKSRHWRRLHVHQHAGQFVAATLEQPAHHILLATVETDAGHRQTLPQSHLVDIVVVQLVLYLIHQPPHLLDEQLVTARRIRM